MDMNTIFSCTAKKLFDGTLVFDGMATKGDTTKQVLEKVQAMMADAKDTCDGVIGMEDEFETFKNAELSASYLLCLVKEGVFPQENTPYDSDWGRTFDSITGSCLNIAFAHALLKSMGDNIVVTDDDATDEAEAAADKAAADKAAADKTAADKAAADKAAADKTAAEEARKAEIARQAKAAAVAETEKSAAEAAAKKAEPKVEAEASEKKPKKGFFKRAKDFLKGEDDESEQPQPRRKKKSTDVLED